MQFDQEIFNKLATDPDTARHYLDVLGSFAMNLAGGLLILVLTFWLARTLSRLIKKRIAQGRGRRRVDVTLANFIASMVRYLIIIVGLIAVLGQVGVKTTSILAVLGAASLAVGLALQGTLGNVAAGVMLLFLRPYRLNDFVEINGRVGTVRSLDLFTTELVSPEGLKLVIPNAKVFGEMIINFNTLGTRRVDIAVGVDYEDDLNKAESILIQVAAHDPHVLADPEPFVNFSALADNSVDLDLRVWVKAQDYIQARSALTKKVKEALDAGGLHIPYPHQVAVSRDEFMGREESPRTIVVQQAVPPVAGRDAPKV